jgi:hypothetical protein
MYFMDFNVIFMLRIYIVWNFDVNMGEDVSIVRTA